MEFGIYSGVWARGGRNNGMTDESGDIMWSSRRNPNSIHNVLEDNKALVQVHNFQVLLN